MDVLILAVMIFFKLVSSSGWKMKFGNKPFLRCHGNLIYLLSKFLFPFFLSLFPLCFFVWNRFLPLFEIDFYICFSISLFVFDFCFLFLLFNRIRFIVTVYFLFDCLLSVYLHEDLTLILNHLCWQSCRLDKLSDSLLFIELTRIDCGYSRLVFR